MDDIIGEYPGKPRGLPFQGWNEMSYFRLHASFPETI
jgi:hypothetical protein